MSRTPLSRRIADAVDQALSRQEVSGSELARRLGVSQTYVWRRLRGEVEFSISDLERIATAIDVRVEDLLPVEVAA